MAKFDQELIGLRQEKFKAEGGKPFLYRGNLIPPKI